MLPSHKHNVRVLAIKAFLISLLCVQGAGGSSGVSTKRRQAEQPPFDMVGIIKALEFHRLTVVKLIPLIAERGVSSRLTPDDEREIRRAGAYLGQRALGELIKALRIYYRPDRVNEPIALQPGMSAEIDYLGFRAEYVGNEGEYYVVKIQYPGTQKFDIRTRQGCEHQLNWGRHKLKLTIESASAGLIKAVLSESGNRSRTPGGGRASAPPPPAEITARADSPCVFTTMRLVVGNNTEVPDRPMAPYYISEPLTVGVLRYHAQGHPVKTPIPKGAKDTDPITSIFYEDADEIATMLGTLLPSLEQWVNAFDAGVVKFSSTTELVTDGRGGLLVVQEADGSHPANTPVSSRIHVRKIDPSGLAVGLIRVVRPLEQSKVIVKPNKRLDR